MIAVLKNYLFKTLFQQIKDNIKYIIYLFVILIIIMLILQFYLFQQNKKKLELSILYDLAISNNDNEIFSQNMNKLEKEKGIFGILSSLELINKKLT